MPLIDVMTCPTVQHGFGGPSSPEFSYVTDQQSSPRGQCFWPLESFLLFRGACGRVWVSLPVRSYVLFPYVSEVFILGARRGDFSYEFGVFDFSNEEVKRVVDIVYRFFSLHS